jgi:hypothetical protein
MKEALKVLGWIAFLLGASLAILTLIFAFSIGIRIVGFLLALFGVGGFFVYVLWSWWIECVVEPIRKRKNSKGK